MTLSQALKEKNRTAGRINKLQGQIKKVNCHKEDKTPDFLSKDLLVKLQEEWAHLINLKSKIAQANIGIAAKLILLTEAKAELQFWSEMTAYSGQARETDTMNGYVNGQYTDIEVVKVSDITSLEVSNQVDRVQSLIEKLQDGIDIYNATKQI